MERTQDLGGEVASGVVQDDLGGPCPEALLPALLALVDGDLLDELGDVGPVGILGTPSGGTPKGLVPDPEGGSSQPGVDLDPHVDGATEPVERLPWAVA